MKIKALECLELAKIGYWSKLNDSANRPIQLAELPNSPNQANRIGHLQVLRGKCLWALGGKLKYSGFVAQVHTRAKNYGPCAGTV